MAPKGSQDLGSSSHSGQTSDMPRRAHAMCARPLSSSTSPRPYP